MTVLQLIQSDYKKHQKYGANFGSIIFLTQGFWVVLQYRITHFVYKKLRVPTIVISKKGYI